MSSSLARAAPIAKIATAPTQVVSRKLRIGILPATMPRVTDARARAVPRVGTRSVGKASGNVSQRNEAQRARRSPILTPRLAYEYVRIPVELTSLKPEAARKSIPRPDRSQPKTLRSSISLAQTTHAMNKFGVKRRKAIGVGVFASRRGWQFCPLAHASPCPLADAFGLPTPTRGRGPSLS